MEIFKGKINYRKVFAAGTVIYLLCILPFLIYRGGLWFYFGDYNVQQVPFYIMCHRMVRSGRFFWNPNLDLGSNMGSSFAFYLWGSPFFWMTIPFPEKAVPYLMPFLMALKYGTALTAAYAWMREQKKAERTALLGAFLYAFSGFQGTNIVFNHFHEATAFFPLFLLSFDHFIKGKRKWGFALMTAFMLIVNYFFFVGEVIFLILYYAVRYHDFKNPVKMLRQTAESFLYGAMGVGAAAFFWVQLLTGVFGNSRIRNVLSGYDMIAYGEQTTLAAILKSAFILPDTIARGTLFSNDMVRVSSLAAYLPCFAMAGVIVFCMTHKNDWKKNMFFLCLLTAAVPVLNASFSAFNKAYYARWYFMPILIMALMTAEILEEQNRAAMKTGCLTTITVTLCIMLCACIPVVEDGTTKWFAVFSHPEILIIQFGVTALMLPFLYYMMAYYTPEKKEGGAAFRLLWLTAVCCMLTTMGALLCGNTIVSNNGKNNWKRQLLDSRPELPDQDTFCRIETDSTSTNYDMVWGYASQHCFQSTINPSIFNFYLGVGLRRTVESTMPFEKIGARSLISTRYFMENTVVVPRETYEEKGGLEGWTESGESAGYKIHENMNFIPMGYTFDTYMREAVYDPYSGKTADRLLVRNLILSEQMAARYGHLMKEDSNRNHTAMSIEEFETHCRKRAASACREFHFDKSGFTAVADIPKDNLVFFSVPFDKGFTAYVDGKQTAVIPADYGLMAVEVPAGEHRIVFTYLPWMWKEGFLMSGGSLLLLLVFSLMEKRKQETFAYETIDIETEL